MRLNLKAMYNVIVTFDKVIFNGKDWMQEQKILVVASAESIHQTFNENSDPNYTLVLTDLSGNIYAYPSTNVLGIIFVKVAENDSN